jgi:formylglycine-generating enzyme required for sulfatase activity
MADNGSNGYEVKRIEIEPVPFRVDQSQRRSPSPLRWLVWTVLVFIFFLLTFSAWFVFTARQVVVHMDPEPERISVSGGIFSPNIGSYYLLRPGEYTVKAFKQCYHPFEMRIRVMEEKSQTLNLSLEKLPGRLSVRAHHTGKSSVDIDGAGVQIDGEDMGITPLQGVDVKSGRRRVDIRSKNYQDQTTHVDIEGCGEFQLLDLALIPGWADVTIGSIPKGASVRLDGKPVGKTPLELDLFPGSHKVEISADRFKTWRTQLVVQANQPQTLENIRLEPAEGTFSLHTNPAGASVTVGEKYAGKTPLDMRLLPDKVHVVRISKAGYEKVVQEIKVSSGRRKDLTVDLVPIEGIVYLTVNPDDAELFVNGKSRGTVRRELRLTTVEHRLEIKKEGYQPFQTNITPRPGFPKELRIILTKLEPKKTVIPALIKAVNGYELKLIRPGPFTMGASRREQGRRSNETLRKVTLRKPFYMGVREVTNKEFKEFLSAHSSGSLQGNSLSRDELPVVKVTWEQAALFCNWLSAKESLPLSYTKLNGEVVAAEPLRIGYRLPTEAEWEYVARFNNNKAPMKYPWGNTFPPPPKSGNFADISAKDLLANYLTGYNDGYLITAHPGAFGPNALGLYDLGGNVAEWCHDYYGIYTYSAQEIYVDPLGPKQGKHRVIKGSSWKDGSISELRLSYRDYSQDERNDVGFRIVRYLKVIPEKE